MTCRKQPSGRTFSSEYFLCRPINQLKEDVKIYMQTVVNTYGSYAFGFLHTERLPECAAAILHNGMLPFYKDKGLQVNTVLTGNGREYCGTETHPYELYLALIDIEHRKTRVRRLQTNGFVERFNRIALEEFFRVAFPREVLRKCRSLAGRL